MSAQFIAAARDWLSAREPLPGHNADAIAEVSLELFGSLAQRPRQVIGISGPPGTGKSTLAGACKAGIEASGNTCTVLSLDDYYLPRREREALARDRHPLLLRRGTPGTHDISLLVQHVSALSEPHHASMELPLFDKATDDRSGRTRHVESGQRPAVLFLEGWLIGVPAEPESALATPVNELESSQDQDGAWRRWTNTKLAEYHRVLAPFIDAHWHLDAPDWPCIVAWRWQQEREHSRPWLENPYQVQDFLATYQRICLHMHRSCGQWSDKVVTLDRQHRPTIRGKR